ncbi:hypothetical protein BOX15_Mlig014585g3, partial [Macrostomum lignano]
FSMLLSNWLIFRLCLTVRISSALWNIIHDCDETYNYWEPLHHLLHGSGFQTWEYSPQYALRSYLYLWLYTPPAILISWLGGSKVTQFYAIRFWMAVWTATAETVAFGAVKQRLDKNKSLSKSLSVYSLAFVAFSATSAGLFVSGTAFLPSSFAMQLAYACLAAWLTDRYALAVACIAAMAIVGWPFAAAIGLPLAVDLIALKRKPGLFVAYSAASGLSLAIPVALADTLAYGRPTLSPINLLSYNVLNSGSHLYGTSPLSYYLMNYALNFTPLLPLILIAGLLATLVGQSASRQDRQLRWKLLLWLSPLLLWNAIFFLQAHKEERFLYPCYPFLCLALAVALETIRHRLGSWAVPCIIAAFAAFSLSRILATTLAYQSHVTIYHRLVGHGPAGRLCLGKEWHRFPSAFLLPHGWSVGFVRSEFRGQLPGRFGLADQPFNLDNREETARYLNVTSDCDYLIDKRSNELDFVRYTELEPDYLATGDWQLLEDLPILEPDKSHDCSEHFTCRGCLNEASDFLATCCFGESRDVLNLSSGFLYKLFMGVRFSI